MTPLASVLIVDDEPAVRALMTRWVTALGMSSVVAANADEALITLKSRHHDLAVIDMRLPGRDGMWLTHEVRRHHPDTAVVIATGYSQLLGDDASLYPIADLLIKPFQRDRFAEAVDR